MTRKAAMDFEARWRERARFGLSPFIEACYALSQVADPGGQAPVHAAWTRAAAKQLSAEFWRQFRDLGQWPFIWKVVPDTVGPRALTGTLEDGVAQLKAQPEQAFATRFLAGVLHDARSAGDLTHRKLTLPDAVMRAPQARREWLLFTGLYPWDPASDACRALQLLIDEPGRFQEAIADALLEFWSGAFRDTWHSLLPRLEASVSERERLFASCESQQFADLLRLRIRVDASKGHIRAVRGGYRLPLSSLREAWFVPSAFNVSHLWHAHEQAGEITAFFPYFDPSLVVGVAAVKETRREEMPGDVDLDPALLFRALGNTTRYAMAMLLAQAPRSAAELGRALSISRATVSHHVHLLREAGAVTTAVVNGAMILQLRRETFEGLSAAVLQAMYGDRPAADSEPQSEGRATR